MKYKHIPLSGIPIAMFHRIIMIRSIIDAKDPMMIVKMSAGRNLHELKKFWYNTTEKKFTTDPTIPVTVI